MQHHKLGELLHYAATAHADKGMSFYGPGGLNEPYTFVSYQQLHEQAIVKAAQLRSLGVQESQIILLHFKTHRMNIEWFWAVTCAGCIPAMSTPFSNDIVQRKSHILYLHTLLEQPLCLTTNDVFHEFSCQDQLNVWSVDDLASGTNIMGFRPIPVGSSVNTLDSSEDPGAMRREDIAALMLTSGSTGNPKAVCLTNKMILTALAAKSTMNDAQANTRFFNWIGLDHVACLTEIHLHAMHVGGNQIHAQAVDIVQDPLSFVNILSTHQVGYTFAPNFFIASLLQALHAPSTSLMTKTIDLSHLTSLISGGEANVVETCASLSEVLQGFGAPHNCIKPAFGMTETCAGSIYNLDFPTHDIKHKHEFASIGRCHQSMEMRIVDESGNEVPRGTSGILEVRGSVVFSTYFRNPEASKDAFHGDWFVTGDQGQIDSAGQLNLTGRTKETLIINGLNYTPHEIEAALDHISGARLSFTVVFPYRIKSFETESVCVVYCPEYGVEDIKARGAVNNSISAAVIQQLGLQPLIIPLNDNLLQKSTLGKLSRSRIRKNFEAGLFDTFRHKNDQEMARFRASTYKAPTTELERQILDILGRATMLSAQDIGVNADLFELGITSISIIRIKRELEQIVGTEVPVSKIITNPTASQMARALERQHLAEYNPVIVLKAHGSKSPLWLIHPGVGEVLVFLGLASHVTDRPIYALRARGFEKGETYFPNITEAVDTYHRHIKRVQPNGPYAIAGYSYGSMLAFEITKQLNRGEHDEVKFLGVLNLPPHIKTRMRQLDWMNCLLHLAYFLGLFTEKEAQELHPSLCHHSHEEATDIVVSMGSNTRMIELGLDKSSLANWADLAYSLQSAAVDYEPTGMVKHMDIFCAIPLAAVANDIEDWESNYLSKWGDFTATAPRIHRVDGAHYTMLSPEHIESFSKKLTAAMERRGM